MMIEPSYTVEDHSTKDRARFVVVRNDIHRHGSLRVSVYYEEWRAAHVASMLNANASEEIPYGDPNA